MKALLLLLCLSICVGVQAQRFDDPKTSFSKKKPLYITLQDGTNLAGTLDKVKRKKVFVKYIKIETAEGDDREIPVEDIAIAYLPVGGITAFANSYEKITNLNNYADTSKSRIVDTLIQDGYALFESHRISIKGKKDERQLLLQVVNPGFASYMKVYLDPIAKQQASAGIGPMTVGGGAKSYYIKKNDSDEIIYLTRKIYYNDFNEIWKSCPSVIKEFKDDIDWDDLPKHVAKAHDGCK